MKRRARAQLDNFGHYDTVTEMAFEAARFYSLRPEPQPRFGAYVRWPGYQPDEIANLAAKIRKRIGAWRVAREKAWTGKP